MRVVRGLLTAGWLILIFSLFWDPVTPELTRPDNLASPFHLQGKTVEVQGQLVPEEPYAMTNRIFWTMLVPLLPLFFLVAGHETWRRICPLSFVSQIPRYLGLNRKKIRLNRRSGLVEKQLALVGQGWWRRNVWYIQFGLLFIALNARHLFLDSDRTALGLFLLGVIATALLVGFLWGGKTWCNYICPVAIVQKIYTEPRGLLESRAHTEQHPVTQSMCRISTGEGDRSNCVACTPNCPDVDLERSYWENIADPSLRHVYYAFFGLIVGFYAFFYLYAGNWDYYFSGVWTREPDQIATLFSPGLYLAGQAIAIPKILATPLVLAFFVLAAVMLGKGMEALYRSLVRRAALPLSEAEIIHHCLVVTAYLSIITFYVFSGRSNLMLLPVAVQRLIDLFILTVTTLWLWRAMQRSPARYRRESLAAGLREQLRRLKVDISKFLGGRKLEELSSDEIYVLAKTLPSFSGAQRLRAYRNILENALRTGQADASTSLGLLRDVRVEIGVSDDEHRQLLNELGMDGASEKPEAEKNNSFENWLRIDSYRRAIETILLDQVATGHKLGDLLNNPGITHSVRKFREIYQISESEHASTIASITGNSDLIIERARHQVNMLIEDAALISGLRSRTLADPDWPLISQLLIRSALRRNSALCSKLFLTLLTLGNTPESCSLAAEIGDILGHDVEIPLAAPVSSGERATWAESLNPELVALLRGHAASGRKSPLAGTEQNAAEGRNDLAGHLKRWVMSDDPFSAALALTAISRLDPALAPHIAREADNHDGTENWLLAEVIGHVTGKAKRIADAAHIQPFTITLDHPGSPQRILSLPAENITIGRAPDNDIIISDQSTSTHHMEIYREGEKVYLRKNTPFAGIYVDSKRIDEELASIASGARISLVAPTQAGPALTIEWKQDGTDYTVESHDTITRLLWLSQVDIFRQLELNSLAEIALSAEVRRYQQGDWLCRSGDLSDEAFILQTGSADIIVTQQALDRKIDSIGAGTIVGEIGVITRQPRTASVQISSPSARILAINGERLRWLMERNASVSMGILAVVATYVKH